METVKNDLVKSSRTHEKNGMYCNLCEFGTNMPEFYCPHLIERAQRRTEAKRKIGAVPELSERRNASADRTRVLAECACGASVWTKRPKLIL